MQYLRYVKSKYGIYCIIFDGYSAGPSTKDHEHERRKTGKSSADIKIEEKLLISVRQHVLSIWPCSILKIIRRSQDVVQCFLTLGNIEATTTVVRAGTTVFYRMYGGKPGVTLDILRYLKSMEYIYLSRDDDNPRRVN